MSFARTLAPTTALPIDLAILLAVSVARQAASTTAQAQHRLAARAPAAVILRPAKGNFSLATAQALRRWQGGRARER